MMSQHDPLEAGDPAPVPVTAVPDPEVPERLERARRRQFTVGYKLRILSEADAARTTGEIGALRSEERRVGKECRDGGARDDKKQKNKSGGKRELSESGIRVG